MLLSEHEYFMQSLKFPVGSHVRVSASVVDFNFFNGETGVVTRNSGKYLGVIVKFDTPRQFTSGEIQETFNFNPSNLELLDDSPAGKWYYALGEDEIPQEFDEKPNGYAGPFATWQVAVADLLERENKAHGDTIKKLKELKKHIKQMVEDVDLSKL